MSKRKGRSRQPRTSEIKSVMRGPRTGGARGRHQPGERTRGSGERHDPSAARNQPLRGRSTSEALTRSRALRTPPDEQEEERRDVPHLRAVDPADATLSSDVDDLGSSESPLDADDDAPARRRSRPLFRCRSMLEGDDTEAFISGLIEALLFTSQKPLALKDIARSAGVDRPRAQELLEQLMRSYGRARSLHRGSGRRLRHAFVGALRSISYKSYWRCARYGYLARSSRPSPSSPTGSR